MAGPAAVVTPIGRRIAVPLGFLESTPARSVAAQRVLILRVRAMGAITLMHLVICPVALNLVNQIGRHIHSPFCYSDDWVTSSNRYPEDSSALMLASSENRYSSGTSAIPKM